MREIRTSGSTRGQWVTSSRPLAYSTGHNCFEKFAYRPAHSY